MASSFRLPWPQVFQENCDMHMCPYLTFDSKKMDLFFALVLKNCGIVTIEKKGDLLPVVIREACDY